MANAKKKNTRKTGAKLGRPSNADRALKQQQSIAQLLDVVGIAASNAAQGAVKAFMDGGGIGAVTTIGTATATAPAAKATSTAPKTPGRNPDPTSKRFKARAMYTELKGTMPRNEIVNAIVKKLGLKKNVANTYYHEAERDAGDVPVSRRPRAKGVAQKAAA